MGARGRCEYLDAFHFLKMRFGGVMELRLEEEAVARQRDAKPPDVLLRSSIAAGRNLGETSRLERLVLVLRGLPAEDLPQTHRQRVLERKDDFAVVELLRGGGAPRSKLTDAERKPLLEATPTEQADHPRIRALAAEITADAASNADKAERIIRWLDTQIEGHYARNASTAVQVLDSKAGDCTEFALLFVSLARAAGLPARQVSGLVAFTLEEETLFGGHAWAEVHDGERWLVVDPSWGEVAVHAGHLRLATGADDWRFLNYLGRLKIEVREVR